MSLLKHFAAVIFDMDGLLLDTERVGLMAFEEACRRLDVALPREVFVRCLGVNRDAGTCILEEALDGAAGVDAFRDVWDEVYTAQLAREPSLVKPGAEPLLAHLAAQGLPSAVATSTPTARARGKLEIAGILRHFRAVIGGDQVTRSKPHPDIYLRAAQTLQVDPATCLALEDSENGVRAAVASGMCVVQVPDLIQPSAELRSLGHIVLSGLADVLEYPFEPHAGRPHRAPVAIAFERPDQAEVIALIAALDACQKRLYPPDSFHATELSALLQPGVLFAVAREGGRAVGCSAVVLGPDHAEIMRMYVDPASRGCGLGARLLVFVEEAACAAGCRRLVLETGSRQDEALALYEHAGYTRCAPFGDCLPDPISIFMEKRPSCRRHSSAAHP
jgi:HAD superfamily hydrolase (TIGR01509 family)